MNAWSRLHKHSSVSFFARLLTRFPSCSYRSLLTLTHPFSTFSHTHTSSSPGALPASLLYDLADTYLRRQGLSAANKSLTLLFLHEAKRQRCVQRETSAKACELLRDRLQRGLKGRVIRVSPGRRLEVEAEGSACLFIYFAL